MSQQFLLSSAARTLSLAKVARMSEDEARDCFPANPLGGDRRQARFARIAPALRVYSFKSRPIFKCKSCDHQFSVTSGTIFANRKLAVRDYLLAIAIFVNEVKGKSALALSRDL